jgi:drug/metabolite transporter (DMT)-like permease
MTKQSKGIIYLGITVLSFSTFEVACKLVGTGLHPLQISFLRFLTGGLVLLPFAAMRMKKRKVKLTLRLAAETSLLGFVNIVVSMGLIQYGLLYTNASTSAVIFSSNPVFVALFAWLMLGERIDMRKIAGMAVGIAGVLILFSDGPGPSFASNAGPLLIAASAVIFALYTVLGKRLTVKGTDSLVMTSLSFIAGSLMLLPAMLIMNIPVTGFDAGLIPMILYLGIIVSGIAYMSYFYGLANVNTSTGALIYFVKPVLAALFSVIILHESLSAYFYTGTAVIIAGLAVVNMKPLGSLLKARAAREKENA